MKSGWRTTEFWVAVVSAVLFVAVAGGYITVEQSEAINNAVVEVINAITKLVTALAPIVAAVSYIWSRTKVKTK